MSKIEQFVSGKASPHLLASYQHLHHHQQQQQSQALVSGHPNTSPKQLYNRMSSSFSSRLHSTGPDEDAVRDEEGPEVELSRDGESSNNGTGDEDASDVKFRLIRDGQAYNRHSNNTSLSPKCKCLYIFVKLINY